MPSNKKYVPKKRISNQGSCYSHKEKHAKCPLDCKDRLEGKVPKRKPRTPKSDNYNLLMNIGKQIICDTLNTYNYVPEPKNTKTLPQLSTLSYNKHTQILCHTVEPNQIIDFYGLLKNYRNSFDFNDPSFSPIEHTKQTSQSTISESANSESANSKSANLESANSESANLESTISESNEIECDDSISYFNTTDTIFINPNLDETMKTEISLLLENGFYLDFFANSQLEFNNNFDFNN